MLIIGTLKNGAGKVPTISVKVIKIPTWLVSNVKVAVVIGIGVVRGEDSPDARRYT